jgi:uncharacterized protein YndB with AHSA1/START domain
MSATRVRRHLRAPRARVYAALVDADAVATWMVPPGMTSEVHVFEPREGGALRISLTYQDPTAAGKSTARTDTYHGRFLQMVPGERVVQVLEFETADPNLQGEMKLTITLTDRDAGCDLVATHEGLPPGLAPADNQLGWELSLSQLADLVERRETTGTSSGFPGRAFFDRVYEGRAPWDLGGPQPDLLRLIEDFPPSGRILDLGSGTGDLAIALAARGLEVLGVEFAEAAAAVARVRADALPPELRARLELRVGDALRPTGLGVAIGAAVDSGFYHLFDGATRGSLVRELTAALPSGGRYYLLGFAVDLAAPDVPLEVTKEELEALFCEPAWRVRALRAAHFHTVGFDRIPALALCAERR